MLVNRILILSQPPAPSSLNLSHALVKQLQSGFSEMGVVMEQLERISAILDMKRGSALL